MLSAHFTPHRGKALRLNLFHGHKRTFVICLGMGSGSGSGDPLDSIDDKPSNLGLVKNQEIESGMKDDRFQLGALSSDYIASVDGSDYMESSLAENCEGQVPMLRKKPNIPADALAGTQQASFFHMLLLTYSRALLTHEASQSPTEFNSASQDSKEAGSATERIQGSMEGAANTKWKVKKRARPTNAASVSGTLGPYTRKNRPQDSGKDSQAHLPYLRYVLRGKTPATTCILVPFGTKRFKDTEFFWFQRNQTGKKMKVPRQTQ
jgi:hypothetical protein